MADTVHLSRAAFDRLKAEHEDLTTRGRIDIARKIETARELGDLSENGDYHAAKEEQGKMEGRIRHLAQLLENAEIVEGGDGGDVVAAGIGRRHPLRGRRRRRALPRRLDRGAPRGPRRHVARLAARRGADRAPGRRHRRLRDADRRQARRSRSSPSVPDQLPICHLRPATGP